MRGKVYIYIYIRLNVAAWIVRIRENVTSLFIYFRVAQWHVFSLLSYADAKLRFGG